MSRAAGLATGHAPSPYLRRLRLPNLGTLRPHDNDDLSPEEEFNKLDLIRARMEEKNRELREKEKKEPKKAEVPEIDRKPFYHPQNLFETTKEKNIKQ